jgi:hypothetical protein
MRTPLANTKYSCIDTWTNNWCQVAAFLKAHGRYTFLLHRNDSRIGDHWPRKNTDHLIILE